MNTTRTLSVAACAAGLASLVPAAAQAALTPGARYDGIAAKPAIRQYVKVSKDATKISDYRLISSGRCSDGESFTTGTNLVDPPAIAVDAAGAFSTQQVEKRTEVARSRKTFTGTVRTTITGQSAPDATSVTVTLAATFVAKGLRCTTSTVASLNRDGTPKAPFANSSATTGSYPGISKNGFRISRFRVLAPGGEIRNFNIGGVASCTDGRRTRLESSYSLILLSPRNTFSIATGRSSVAEGRSGSAETLVTDRLRLRLFKRGARYGYSGTYSVREVVKRRGRATIRCEVPRTRFSTLISAG